MSKDLDIESKFLLFQMFIQSLFNFCPVVWHFCTLLSVKKKAKVQARALRFVYNDHVSSYDTLREKANRPLLYVHRLRCLMLEVYKIVNEIGPSYLKDMFTEKHMMHIVFVGLKY
jgi:hypothetical protein